MGVGGQRHAPAAFGVFIHTFTSRDVTTMFYVRTGVSKFQIFCVYTGVLISP